MNLQLVAAVEKLSLKGMNFPLQAKGLLSTTVVYMLMHFKVEVWTKRECESWEGNNVMLIVCCYEICGVSFLFCLFFFLVLFLRPSFSRTWKNLWCIESWQRC